MSESASGKAVEDTLSDTKKERFECKGCGEEFISYPSQTKGWCSRDCYTENRNYSGENNPNYSGGNVVVTCEYCNSEYETIPSNADGTRFCSRDCKSKWQSENRRGENHPLYSRIEVECAECGEVMQRKANEYEKYDNLFCGNQCRSEYYGRIFVAEDHPNWNPNSTGEGFYQTERWNEARIDALKRDNFNCQYCGEWDTKLHVHHIHPISEGGSRFDLDNLVTLCMSCHNKWEGLYLRPDTR